MLARALQQEPRRQVLLPAKCNVVLLAADSTKQSTDSSVRSWRSNVAMLLFIVVVIAGIFWWHSHQTQKTFNSAAMAFQKAVNVHALATGTVTSTIAAADQSMLGMNSSEYAILAAEIKSEHDIERLLFAPVIKRSQRFDFEMGQAMTGVPEFDVHDVSGETVPLERRDGLMAPVIRAEPFDPGMQAYIAVDLLSSPQLEAYVRRSVSSGRAVLGRAALADGILTGNDSSLFNQDLVVVRSVYRGTTVPVDIHTRREKWRGIYVAFMKLDKIWSENIESFRSDSVRLLNHSEAEQNRTHRSLIERIFWSRKRAAVSIYSENQVVDAGFVVTARYPRPLVAAGIAVILAALISWLFMRILGETQLVRQRAREVADLADKERLRAEQTLTVIGDAVVRTNSDFQVTYVNNMARTMFGSSLESLDNVRLETLLEPIDSVSSEFNEPGAGVASTSVLSEGDYRFIDPENGDELILNLQRTETNIIEGEDGAWIFVIRDVGVERAMANELEWRASRDELTGLLNRHSFEKVATDIIAADPGCSHAMCIVDLDNFKVINDTAGHATGDEMLRQVAHTLNAEVRSVDVTARLGGDEFGFLLVNIDDKEIDAINERMVSAIRGCRVSAGDQVFQVGASIGIAITENRRWNVEELMHNADSACYAAKKSGRGRSVVFRADDIHINQRESDILWLNEIPKALESDRFFLDVQPIIAVADNKKPRQILEILVRLISDTGKVVYPGDFIPAAERHNLMPAIDRWVIETAFREIGRNSQDSAEGVYSINLSSRTLDDPNLYRFVNEQLEISRVSADQICFELTETAAVSDVGHASDFLNSMRDLGCKIALDDFGSGLASFRYLRSFPADFLKLDRSLVLEAAEDDRSRRLLEGVVDLARDMGLGTVAEGVEDKYILQLMQSIGVDYVQGYYIEEPELFFSPNTDPEQSVTVAQSG